MQRRRELLELRQRMAAHARSFKQPKPSPLPDK
ncbi:hypothetical protein PF005_g29241 [Phytophthora fragariae]|nr:hypothetical protein PF011_g33113 [Phytophthora fragariae]KAE8998561.1 hypothetical protein PR002_g18704 [Phytophthora rubi]KAE8963906.1 hypothetical protein PF011_g28862 [Phytophthora fragariae]KAE8964024.1 hypothetical protein PF011_g28819 [Phytophthora fragariae]KAE9008127.1 hypothetical protein PR001_g16790 [Phytophthora rubi]